MNGLFARARSLWRGLRRPEQLSAEMDEEMRFHLEMEAERLVREHGLAPAEARRRAALAFGSVERYKEEGRDVRGLWVTGMALDFKLGLRMLARYPGLALVAGLALSVAIGGGAAYMELVNDLYRPSLPFPAGDRLVGIYTQDVAKGQPGGQSLRDLLAWREELDAVEELGAFRTLDRNLVTADGRAEPVEGVEVSPAAFRLAGVPPLLGRPLVQEDERQGAPPVVVLGHGLWQARFGGDPAVVGRSVRLGSTPHTVVGVMPPEFGFPVNHGLWAPLRLDAPEHPRDGGRGLLVFGRLAPGVSLQEAQAELSAAGLRAAADLPDTHQHLRPRVRPYVQALVHSDPDGAAQRFVVYSLNLFFLALLGVCGANVATLVFARTATREGEITVRTALGARRGRIVLQLFAEALVLTATATAVGLAAAALGLGWVKRAAQAAGGTPPFWWDDRLSPTTLLYAGVLTLATAAIVGIVPALKATGAHLQARLRQAAAGGSGMKFGRLWTGVIVAQVALTVVFLLVVVSVGWNVRVGRYGTPEAAFPAREYLAVRLEMDREIPAGTPVEQVRAEHRARFAAAFRELERRVADEPGVTAVTYASHLPGTNHPKIRPEVDGAAPPRLAGETWVPTAAVDADFFDALQAPIVSGRTFSAADVETDRDVAIVNQTFVREILGGRDPVGLRVRQAAVGDDEPGPWYEIVGVVRDLTARPGSSAEDAVLYRPAAPGADYPLHMAVHVRGQPAALAPRLRGLAAAVDPSLRLHDLMPMDEMGREGQLAYGIFVRVLAVIGAIALLLCTAGVYSLMSFTVARRTREIGIRAALGAAPRRLVASVLSRSFAQVGLGILAGSLPGSLLVAWGAPEVARGGGAAVGAAAFVGVALFMAVVGLLASAVPAKRALRIQPTEALRTDG